MSATTAIPPPALDRRTSPYQGLRPYNEEDAPFFFGRDEWRDTIIDNLLAHPLTVLYGASGVGKSSVLRAGVVTELRRRHAKDEVPPLAIAVFDGWRDDPLGGLTRCMTSAVEKALPGHPVPVPTGATLSDRLSSLADQLGGRLIVILDQFELYFVYHGRNLETKLATELPDAVGESNWRVHYLIAVREDALAKLDAFQTDIPNLFDNLLRIDPLDRKSARQAITDPVDRFNEWFGSQFSVDQELVGAVLNEVDEVGGELEGTGRAIAGHVSGEGAIPAPYLQLVMDRLWSEETASGSSVLQRSTLERLGGARNIVRHHLDVAMDALTPKERAVAAQMFHYLVSPSGTKFAHTASDLSAYTELPTQDIARVLDRLAEPDVRIVRRIAPPARQGADAAEPSPRYEIFHDALGPAVLDWRVRELSRRRPTFRKTFRDFRGTWLLSLLLGWLPYVRLRLADPPFTWREIGRICMGSLAACYAGIFAGFGLGYAVAYALEHVFGAHIGSMARGNLVGYFAFGIGWPLAAVGAVFAARKPNWERFARTGEKYR